MSVRLPEVPVPVHWLLDANVLFSEWARWLMVALAEKHGAMLYWTPHIENECFRNLVRLGRLHPDDAAVQRQALPTNMRATLLPTIHEPYVADVRMVDEKDRHVAGAALALRHRLQENVGLITWNLRDFPKKPLLKLGVVRLCPDELAQCLLPNSNVLNECLGRSVELMQQALGTQNLLSPTSYQLKAQPLPTGWEEWKAFLGRNRMHKAAKMLNVPD